MPSDTAARVVHVASGRTLAAATIADTPLTRMVGLLAQRQLAPGRALVLRPCSSIHTWFMRFSIDVLFINAAGDVVHAVERMRPFRVTWARGAAAAVELAAGAMATSGVRVGERLRIDRP